VGKRCLEPFRWWEKRCLEKRCLGEKVSGTFSVWRKGVWEKRCLEPFRRVRNQAWTLGGCGSGGSGRRVRGVARSAPAPQLDKIPMIGYTEMRGRLRSTPDPDARGGGRGRRPRRGCAGPRPRLVAHDGAEMRRHDAEMRQKCVRAIASGRFSKRPLGPDTHAAPERA